MTEDRWQQIKNLVKQKYSLEDAGTEDLLVDTADGPVKQGTAEYVIFMSPIGRLKLAFQTKPRLLDKQYHYSHRAGTAARVEYKFSEDEVVHTFKAYKYDEAEDEWKEIDPSSFEKA